MKYNIERKIFSKENYRYKIHLSCLMSLLLLMAFGLNEANAKHYEIHIGAKSTDGSGMDTPWGPVTWGGDCISALGICMREAGLSQVSTENFEVFTDLTAEILLLDPINIDNLNQLAEGDYIILTENVAIYDENISQDFEFLEEGARYFIPKGRYPYEERSDGGVII